MSRLLTATDAQVQALRRVIADRGTLRNKSAQPSRAMEIEFLIDSAEPLPGTDNRSLYTLKQSRINPATMLPAAVDGGLEVLALNRWEDGNTDAIVAPGGLLADLPPDWLVYPVSYGPGGARAHLSVVASFGFRHEGVDYWRFQAPYLIDGPCPEASSESGA